MQPNEKALLARYLPSEFLPMWGDGSSIILPSHRYPSRRYMLCSSGVLIALDPGNSGGQTVLCVWPEPRYTDRHRAVVTKYLLLIEPTGLGEDKLLAVANPLEARSFSKPYWQRWAARWRLTRVGGAIYQLCRK